MKDIASPASHSFPSMCLFWIGTPCIATFQKRTSRQFASFAVCMQLCKCAQTKICRKYVQVCSSDSSKCASVQVCKFDSMQVCKCGGDGPSPRSFEGRIRSGPAEYPPHTISCWHSPVKIQSKMMLTMSPVFILKLFSTKYGSKSDSKQIFQWPSELKLKFAPCL